MGGCGLQVRLALVRTVNVSPLRSHMHRGETRLDGFHIAFCASEIRLPRRPLAELKNESLVRKPEMLRYSTVSNRVVRSARKLVAFTSRRPKSTGPLQKDTRSWGRHGSCLNLSDDLYAFTRGRFVVNEQVEMAARRSHFDAEALGRVAAHATGSAGCIKIEKHADGMCNKTLLLTMNDGKEVFVKLPTSNAGMVHYTTASEVATADYVRCTRTRSKATLTRNRSGLYWAVPVPMCLRGAPAQRPRQSERNTS